MTVEQYLNKNNKKLEKVSERDWIEAVAKCHDFLRNVRKLKTLYGAHTEKNLNDDPYQYYIKFACEAIMSGRWEWRDHTLSEQLIRIMGSKITKVVGKHEKSDKEQINLEIPIDIEATFYNLVGDDQEVSKELQQKMQDLVDLVESAINGDFRLETIWEGVKEGLSRQVLSEVMELTPRQFDKQIERFKNTVQKHAKSLTNG
jgi:hypothetical protein